MEAERRNPGPSSPHFAPLHAGYDPAMRDPQLCGLRFSIAISAATLISAVAIR
jgi:hypothetical protein